MSMPSQRGIALILVLWVTMLLTVIAGSFAYATRVDMSVLGNSVLRARAEAAADAGVHRAIFESQRPLTDLARWKQDGSVHEFRLADATVRVSVLDESAKIDVNEGSPALMRGLLLSVGVPEPEAVRLVDAIQDWRDADQLSRPNGAEEPAYREAGLKHKPANAPFETLDELRLVIGMNNDLFRRIEPMITIYSRQPGVNLLIASREVLLTIPGVTAEQVDAYLAAREAARVANQPAPIFTQGLQFGGVPSQSTVGVQSEATLPGGAQFVRQAVLKSIPDNRRPYAVVKWGELKTVPPVADGTEDIAKEAALGR